MWCLMSFCKISWLDNELRKLNALGYFAYRSVPLRRTIRSIVAGFIQSKQGRVVFYELFETLSPAATASSAGLLKPIPRKDGGSSIASLDIYLGLGISNIFSRHYLPHCLLHSYLSLGSILLMLTSILKHFLLPHIH